MNNTPPSDPEQSLPSLSILAVEDNSVNQLILSTILSRMGQSVDMASDGEEAVRKASDHDYDLILMDIQLPGMDGKESCRIIRKGRNGNTPVFAMTADSEREELEACMESGMNGYLLKPYRAEDLERTIRSVT